MPEGTGKTDFDCVHKITDILIRMDVPNSHNIKIVRCHRLGKYKSSSRPKPIIVKFTGTENETWYGDTNTT